MKFTAKEKALESEKNHFKNKATEFERVLKKNRKNENMLKEEAMKVKNQLNISKQAFDRQLFTMQSENERLKETLNYNLNELNNKISELTRQNTSIRSQFDTCEEERDTLRAINVSMKDKLDELASLKSELEQIKIDHQNATMKIKELEYEVSSYGDWKDLSKASHTRMHNMSDLEKEVERLRQTNKSIHDSLGNKLLLEEQVHDLQARLKRTEGSHDDVIGLKVQIEALDKELKDWKQLGVDYAQKSAANNPINLRTYIEQLLHKDLLLVSEKSNVNTEKSNIQGQLGELRNVSLLIKKVVVINSQQLCDFSAKRSIAKAQRATEKVTEEPSVGLSQAAEKIASGNSGTRFTTSIVGELRERLDE